MIHHMTGIVDVVTEMLGVAIHELLFVRQLYPIDVFESCRYLGIEVHAAQHPGIIDYVNNVLQVAVPALCEGTADALCFVIVPGNSDASSERYIFEFDTSLAPDEINSEHMLISSNDTAANSVNGQIVRSRLVDLERNFRDLILKIITLSADPRRIPLQNDTTFKLLIRKSKTNQSADKGSEGILQKEILSGRWIQSSPTTSFDTNTGNTSVLRAPLKDMSIPLCGLNISFSLDHIQVED